MKSSFGQKICCEGRICWASLLLNGALVYIQIFEIFAKVELVLYEIFLIILLIFFPMIVGSYKMEELQLVN